MRPWVPPPGGSPAWFAAILACSLQPLLVSAQDFESESSPPTSLSSLSHVSSTSSSIATTSSSSVASLLTSSSIFSNSSRANSSNSSPAPSTTHMISVSGSILPAMSSVSPTSSSYSSSSIESRSSSTATASNKFTTSVKSSTSSTKSYIGSSSLTTTAKRSSSSITVPRSRSSNSSKVSSTSYASTLRKTTTSARSTTSIKSTRTAFSTASNKFRGFPNFIKPSKTTLSKNSTMATGTNAMKHTEPWGASGRKNSTQANENIDFYSMCNSRFFSINKENAEAANVANKFGTAIQELQQNNRTEFEKDGELRLFTKVYAGIVNFRCNMNDGCTAIPTCEHIAEHVRKANLGMSVEEIRTETRWILFAFEDIKKVSTILSNIAHVIEKTQVNVAAAVTGIALDFFPQKNEGAENLCEILHMVIDIAEDLASFAGGMGASKSVLDGVSGAAVSGGIGLFIDLVFIAAKTSVRLVDIDGVNTPARASFFDEKNWNTDGLYVSPTANLMCGRYGAGRKDETLVHSAALHDLIVENSKEQRGRLKVSHDQVFKSADPNHSPLSLLFAYPGWSSVYDELDDTISVESAYTDKWKQRLITAAWKHGRCYMKKAEPKDKKQRSEWCSEKAKRRELRFCPLGDGYVGQAGCWTIQREGNHETLPPGLDKIQKYGLSVSDVIHDMYYNSIPTRRDGEVSPFSDNETPVETKTDLSVATCISPHNKITDFTDNINSDLYPLKDQQFPCTCAVNETDWRSNGTRRFMHDIASGGDSIAYTRGDLEQLLGEVCPQRLMDLNLPPLTEVFAYCSLEIQYPPLHRMTKDRPSNEMLIQDGWIRAWRGPNEHCGALHRETDGMTEAEGNWYFCDRQSVSARAVLDGEAEYMNWKPFAVRHSTQCKIWMGKNKASKPKSYPS